MQQDKHTYIIIGLLVVIIALLLGLWMEVKKPAGPLVEKAGENLSSCRAAVEAWHAKYKSLTAADEAARSELSSILEDCSSQIGETGR